MVRQDLSREEDKNVSVEPTVKLKVTVRYLLSVLVGEKRKLVINKKITLRLTFYTYINNFVILFF